MIDYVTAGSLIGLAVFGLLWRIASSRTLYVDTDNEPVSWKSISGWLWILCLVIFVANQLK